MKNFNNRYFCKNIHRYFADISVKFNYRYIRVYQYFDPWLRPNKALEDLIFFIWKVRALRGEKKRERKKRRRRRRRKKEEERREEEKNPGLEYLFSFGIYVWKFGKSPFFETYVSYSCMEPMYGFVG